MHARFIKEVLRCEAVRRHPVVEWAATADGNWIELNEHWSILTGRSIVKSLGHGWLEGLAASQRPQVERQWQAALAGCTPLCLDVTVICADGREQKMLFSSTPVNSDDGEIYGYVGYLEVPSPTEIKLRASLQQAHTALAVHDHFLATISHELRTPLSSIQSWVYVLERALERAVASPVPRAVAGIKIGVDQQVKLLDDLLDAACVMSDRVALLNEMLKPADLLEEASLRLQTKLQAKQIQLHREIAAGVEQTMLQGDRNRMVQAIENIVFNAIRFSESGGTIVTAIEVQGKEVRISVTDYGRGIASRRLSSLRNPYPQWGGNELGESPEARLQPFVSIGLKLTLTRRLLALHGGRLTLDSAGEGLGTECAMYFPLIASCERAVGGKVRREDLPPVLAPYYRALLRRYPYRKLTMTHPEGKSLAKLSDAQRFELLVTSVKDYAIYMLDTDGFVVSWNAGAERFKGYTASEVIGKHFSLFYTEEDKQSEMPEKALRSSVAEGTFEAEGWRLRKDGSRFWASVVMDPIRDVDGILVGFAKVTRDISERKAAQEALRQSEQQFRLLVQGVTDYAIYMLSPAGEVVSWNAGAERIKGYRLADIVGQHFSRFYTDEDRAKGVPALTLAIAAKEGRVEREGWRVRKDGSRFWAHVVVDAIRDEMGGLIGFAKVTRDVTERKQAAEALDQANQALVHAQKMEALGQLTGGVAHDFNNLLAVLSNGLQVLTAQSRTHLDAKMIQMMQRAVDRGASLTQQLLSFARQQPLQTEKFHLNALIREFEPLLRRVGSTSIRCEVRLTSEKSAVLLDAARFEAALLNLVANSRDAMPDGGAIVISTETVELRGGVVGTLPAASYIKVSVADTGMGMSHLVATRALEPFFTTKEPGRGTGLGLSQVYGFITQSGGDVVIKSAEGEGTTIELYLPAIDDNADSADEYANRLSVETVLLVEDEPDLLAAVSELFRSIGYEVVTAANVPDAIDILKENPAIDILFSDIVMGHGMSGIELARWVSRDYPAVKIVLTSGFPQAALRRDHGEISDFTFIHKPYRLADLAKALRAS